MSVCPIWNTPATRKNTSGDGVDVYSTRAGGNYWVSGSAIAILEDWGFNDDLKRAKLSQYILEANILGGAHRITSLDLGPDSAIFRHRTLQSSFDLLMKSIAQNHPRFGVKIPSTSYTTLPDDFYISIGWPEPKISVSAFSALQEFLRYGEKRELILSNSHAFWLTFEGFKYVEALGLSTAAGESIFVAMWFGDADLHIFYDKAIKPAIQAAGYSSIRIDDHQHNERIDEQILAQIRKSKAVIVDITCGLATPDGWGAGPVVGAPRGGVYFEAGFAVALGKPVIWCVKDDLANLENVVHFDVRQYNQIRWKSDHVENAKMIQARIEATLGRGSQPFD